MAGNWALEQATVVVKKLRPAAHYLKREDQMLSDVTPCLFLNIYRRGEGTMILCNIGNYLQVDKLYHPSRYEYLSAPIYVLPIFIVTRVTLALAFTSRHRKHRTDRMNRKKYIYFYITFNVRAFTVSHRTKCVRKIRLGFSGGQLFRCVR